MGMAMLQYKQTVTKSTQIKWVLFSCRSKFEALSINIILLKGCDEFD